MKFIGIDLAWTYKNETGLCVLSDAGEILYLDAKVYSDEDMIKIMLDYAEDDLCIAIDAPLVIENEQGAREADRLLTRARIHGHQVKLFMANRNFFNRSYGIIRGEVLAEKIKTAFKEAGHEAPEFDFLPQAGRHTIVETFPTAICCGMFPDLYPVRYKVKAKVAYEETNKNLHAILEGVRKLKDDETVVNADRYFDFRQRPVSKKEHKHVEDMLDAFLCSYGMYSIYTQRAQALSFGQIHDGFITIPVAVASDKA